VWTDAVEDDAMMKLLVSRLAATAVVSSAMVTACSSIEQAAGTPVGKNIAMIDSDIQKIVRSPIEFKYERPDQESLVRFRKQAKLDEVIGAGTDFEQLVRLMDWVGSSTNDRTTRAERGPKGYHWGVDRLCKIDENGKPTIYGHCMSYAAVMVDACSALGFKARHYATVGFREMSHEVVEAWVPSLGRWIYFDPSLTEYYRDIKTGEPLSLMDMHRIIVNSFIPEGKDMTWFIQRYNEEARAELKRIGGKNVIACREGPYHYGQPSKPGYDWAWQHGYLVAGFLQMTPRNDFNSRPEANPGQFENYPGYAGYPFWVDGKTPAKPGVKSVYSKESDFYWTLDQAAFELAPAAGKDGVLTVKLENSMPFFSHYSVTIDGKIRKVEGQTFDWTLRRGANAMEVAPVDEFGKTGKGSKATVRYGR
jgi:hypothetical protein